MSPFLLAWRSLARRKASTLTALISIAISVGCAGWLLRVNHLTHARFSSMAPGGDAVVGAKSGGLNILLNSLNLEGPYPNFLPHLLLRSLQRQHSVIPESTSYDASRFIRQIVPMVFFAKYGPYRAIGTTKDLLNLAQDPRSPSLAMGKWAGEPGETVLGAEVAKTMQLRIGEEIPLQPWISNYALPSPASAHETFKLKIVGILKASGTSWDRAVFADMEQAFTVFRAENIRIGIWGERLVHYLLLNLEPETFPALESIVNNQTVAQAVSIKDQRAELERLTGTGRKMTFSIVGLILALGGLSVTTLMVTRFQGMNYQFAVLIALGYSKTEIAKWLFWEGMLLGIAACALGGLLDYAGFFHFRELLSEALPPNQSAKAPFWLSYPIWLTALAGTALASCMPMLGLHRRNIHRALLGVH